MNNLTKIAALPTGGGCQSALRPEDRGAESKPAKTGAPQQLVPILIGMDTAKGESVSVVLTSHSSGEVTHATMSAVLARKIGFFKGEAA